MLPPKGLGAGGRVLAGGGAAKRWFVVKGSKNREAAEQLIHFMAGAVVGVDSYEDFDSRHRSVSNRLGASLSTARGCAA